MEIITILGITLLLTVLSIFIRNYKMLSAINILGHIFILSWVIKLIINIINLPPASIINFTPFIVFGDFFYADALSGLFLLIISIINIASLIFSIDYIHSDLKENIISKRQSNLYYVFFNGLAFAMFLVVLVNNLGFLWVAIELTTLISALLVGFYNKKTSVEAAWKYIIVCSVGISIALFGTILFYYAASLQGLNSFNLSDIVTIAANLDPKILKVAFLFILIGYGTKAGIVPMHTWLPDAHSQAPAPISALLSGVLLKTAIYAILRFMIIVNACVGSQFSSNLFLLFGTLSLGLAAVFIIVQKDIKRLLAYSSIEHIGIILVGLGFGGIGLYGALLHMFNHAVTKSFMFFGAGNIVKKYKASNMNIIRGVINVIPFTGALFILGAFALGGIPPFSIFLSEFTIVLAGFKNSNYLVVILFLLFIAIIFGAIIHHSSKIVFGKQPEGITKSHEPPTSIISMIFLFIFIISLGVFIPNIFNRLLFMAVDIIKAAK